MKNNKITRKRAPSATDHRRNQRMSLLLQSSCLPFSFLFFPFYLPFHLGITTFSSFTCLAFFSFATLSSSNEFLEVCVGLTLPATSAPHHLVICLFIGYLNLNLDCFSTLLSTCWCFKTNCSGATPFFLITSNST